MNRLLSNLPIKLCIVLALAATGSARAEDALPSQELGLAGALENHPDIVAAKAKVALVNAELYGKRIEVSRQVLGLYGSLKKLDAQIDASKAVLSQSKAEVARLKEAEAKGVLDPTTKNNVAVEARAAEAQLVQSIGQREQAEKELRLLIGTASPAAEERLSIRATAVAQQTPQGPVVEKMKTALEKPIKLDFADTPLADIMPYLTDKTGVMFSLQKQALEAAGIGADQPIMLNTSEVPLHAALQAFQDSYPDLQFVLRDYGVLVTTKESSEEHGYAPVLEWSKESAAPPKSR
jgi:Outer membrane efflux protein